VVGHHPHTPKAVEQYGNGLIFYSIGNYLTTGNLLHDVPPHARWNIWWEENDNLDGSLYSFPKHCRMALQAKLTISKNGVERVAAVPMYINKLAQPEPLTADDPRFQQIVEHMEWVSDQHPHKMSVEGDELVFEHRGSGA